MQKKVKVMLILFVFVIVLGIVYFFTQGLDSISVCFQNNCFSVQIADSPAEREQGLMFVQHLDDNSGMLFILSDPGKHGFWMRNTKIVLDIIWLDEQKRVVYIKKNAEPCTADLCEVFLPDKEAKYVLEIPGGSVDKLGVILESQAAW